MNTNFLLEEKKVDNKFVHSIWAEKYRPKTLNDYIGNDTFKNELKKIIEKNDLGHMILYGSVPGTGKTSAAKLIVNSINCDYLYLNCSDTNSIDDVRDKIKSFASSVGFKQIKVVICDEADFFSGNALAALRVMLEQFAQHTRFIFCCNYIEKIIAPIISRCQTFEIIPPSKKEIAQHLARILDNEQVKYEVKDVAFIINNYYPDIRKVINFAQQSCNNGLLKIATENAVESDFKNKLIEFLKTPNQLNVFGEIRQLLANADVSSYDTMFKYLYDKMDEFTPSSKESDVIIEIADSIYQSTLVFEKEITFLACITRLLKILKKKD